MLLLKALVLGVVEGLTEFLPISSTGHLILVGDLLDFNDQKGLVFEIVIQTGAMLAILVEYRKRFTGVLLGLGSDPKARSFVINLIVAFVPAAVLGLAFNSAIKAALFKPVPVAIAFIVGGLIIIWVERRKHVVRVKSVDDMTWRDALKIGIAQSFALIPGTSRSGATIIGGLLFGLSRRAATEFSFFLAVPTLDLRRRIRRVETPRAVRRARHRRVRRGHGCGVRLGVRVRALVDALHRDARLHHLRVVSNRLRRDRAVDGVERHGQLDAVGVERAEGKRR